MDTDGSTHDTTMQVLIENFTPCPDLASIEYMEQTYNTVLIGDQCWMRENLNAGEMISGFENVRNDGTIEKYCYNNDPNNCKTFGGLYQWDELMQYTPKDSTGICPEGWHIPTENDFDVLINYLGGAVSGEKLKEAGSLYWLSPEINSTNNSGFAALPGGIGGGDNAFNEIGAAAYFATTKHKRSLEEYIAQVINPFSNEPIEITYTKNTSYNIVLAKDSPNASYDQIPSYKGVSVRCIKNKSKDEPQSPIAKFHYYHPFPKPLKKPTYRLFKFNPFHSYDNQDPDSELLVSWNWDWKNNKHQYTEFRNMKIIEKLLEQDRTYVVKLIVMDTDENRDTTTHHIKVAKNTSPHAIISFRKCDCGDTSTWFPFKAIYSWDNEYRWRSLTSEWDYDVEGLDPSGGITKDISWSTPPYNWSTRHKYNKPGIYTVKLIVTNPDGLTDIRYAEAKVCDPKSPPLKNKPPKACFTIYPKKGTTCDVFKFDATCSSDFEDPIDSLKFCWFFDWGKHRKYPDLYWSKKNRIVKHKYTIPVEDLGYSIRLGVMDTEGKKRFITRKYLKVAECEDTIVDIPPGTKEPGIEEPGTEEPGTEKPGTTEKPKITKDLPYIPKGTKYTPPTTNCPPNEYLLYLPFTMKGDEFRDSLNKIASQGYMLKAGSFAICFFEREKNKSTIYPVKVLENNVNIEELNELANQNWVVVNGFALMFLIKEKNPPLYRYKFCEDISYHDLSECKNYFPGGENIELFNDYGERGWELLYIGGKPLFRKIKDSKIQYRYMSFNLHRQDIKALEKLGKEGWQYCARLNIYNCLSGQKPVILKQRVGMGDSFSFQAVPTEDPNASMGNLSFFHVAGNLEKEKQWIRSLDPLISVINKYGKAGWVYEMHIEANEDYYGKNKILIVFQVSGNCR